MKPKEQVMTHFGKFSFNTLTFIKLVNVRLFSQPGHTVAVT